MDKVKVIVSLGAGNVLIQPSEEVEIAENGPQVQIDFFRHKGRHDIGEAYEPEKEIKREEWEHLACIGSNRVESLNVLIEEITKARDLLQNHAARARSE